jgi:F420-0:gamma-glutamyl ligase
VADAGGDHLRHGAECDAAECDQSPVAGTFVYTPALGAGARTPGDGQTLSVTFTPTDARTTRRRRTSVTIDVAKATPAITWADARGDHYGTALSATQLNATSPVAGHVRLHAGAERGADCRDGQSAVGDVHADRRVELHDRDGRV